jgi:hypothetical protein
MSAQKTPGPWRVEDGQKRGVHVVVRSMGDIYVQYLSANGKAKPRPSNFRSVEAAHAAIAKATGSQP